MEKIKKLFVTAASKNGSYSVGLIAMAVAAVILFNLVVGQLPESVKEMDISDNRLYEITEVSRDLIDGLEDQVSIKVLQNREDLSLIHISGEEICQESPGGGKIRGPSGKSSMFHTERPCYL